MSQCITRLGLHDVILARTDIYDVIAVYFTLRTKPQFHKWWKNNVAVEEYDFKLKKRVNGITLHVLIFYLNQRDKVLILIPKAPLIIHWLINFSLNIERNSEP